MSGRVDEDSDIMSPDYPLARSLVLKVFGALGKLKAGCSKDVEIRSGFG